MADANDQCVMRVDLEFVSGGNKEVWIGLGIPNLSAVDQNYVVDVAFEKLEHWAGLAGLSAGGDGPTYLHLVQRLEQLDCTW